MRTIPRKLALVAAALVASTAAVTALVGPAAADPPSGTTPAATDLTAAGSDTIQVVDNNISAAVGTVSGTSKFYSWDATPAGNILAKSTCNPTTGEPRPNGSGSGVSALTATYNGLNSSGFRNCFDIARTSRGEQPSGTTPTDYIPFAKDVVGWSAFTGGNAPANLTSQQLINIFTCTPNGTQVSSFKWTDVVPAIPGASATTVHVYIPQSGSGTRTYWLGILGLASTYTAPCWQATQPEENEGTNSAFTTDKDAIFPYSLGHYVGQKYLSLGSGSDNVGVLDTNRQLDGINQLTISGTTGVINTTVPAASKGISAYLNPVTNVSYFRLLAHVVWTADWTKGSGADWTALHTLLNKSTDSPAGYICSHTSFVTGAGFLTLPAAQCGLASSGS